MGCANIAQDRSNALRLLEELATVLPLISGKLLVERIGMALLPSTYAACRKTTIFVTLRPWLGLCLAVASLAGCGNRASLPADQSTRSGPGNANVDAARITGAVTIPNSSSIR